MKKMSVIKCRASIEEVQMLEHYSELLGKTKSEIVRTALKEHFEKLEKENAEKQKEEAFKIELYVKIAGRQPAGYVTIREYKEITGYWVDSSSISNACRKGFYPNAYQEERSKKWMIPYYDTPETGKKEFVGYWFVCC